MSTENAATQQAGPPSGVEQRAARRHLIQQHCLIALPGVTGPEGWRSMAYNISTNGIGVILDIPLQPGVVVEIEPWNMTGTKTRRARVIHCKPLEFAWAVGCEWSEPLSDDELQAWLGGKRPSP